MTAAHAAMMTAIIHAINILDMISAIS